MAAEGVQRSVQMAGFVLKAQAGFSEFCVFEEPLSRTHENTFAVSPGKVGWLCPCLDLWEVHEGEPGATQL